MQILPAFAYLVPIVVLFSIGNPAGIIATFIYAVPPLVRFTEIGIRSVRKDVIEAAQSFGRPAARCCGTCSCRSRPRRSCSG